MPLAVIMVSVLSPLYSDDYRAIAERLGVEYRDDVDWRERQRMLLDGRAHLAFLCGLPYTRESRRLTLLAAPVFKGARYENKPIYFSDVVVRADSPYQTFADLRGARFAYNEPGSQSGHNIVRYQLALLGQTEAFFGKVVESGAHAESVELIQSGEVDASAIDSTVLERMDQTGLRVVGVLGPSPIQPVVASHVVAPETCERLREILLGLDFPPDSPFRRMAEVHDADYDEIRRMERSSAHIVLASSC